jgi:hypothetical protein
LCCKNEGMMIMLCQVRFATYVLLL